MSVFLLIIAIIFSRLNGILEFRAAVVTVVLLLAGNFRVSKNKYVANAGGLVFFALVIALFLHLVPGFHNLKVLNAVKFSKDSLPFTMYLNFDKALAGVLLLANLPLNDTRRDWQGSFRWALIMLVALVATLLPLTLISGYVHWDPKFPQASLTWALNNLLFVAMAEEALFRGLVQSRCERWIGKYHWSAPVIVAALLFGTAHYAGGWQYMLLATLAGTCCGIAFQKTKSIETAILTHFFFNVIHFFLFSYPALG